MFTLHKNKIILSNGENTLVENEIHFDNEVKIICPNKILCLIEMKDRVIVLLRGYYAENLYDIGRNIFCYSIQTGKLLWQVDESVDVSGLPEGMQKSALEGDMFVGMSVVINEGKENKEWYDTDLLDKPIKVPNFNLTNDLLRTGTFKGFQFKLNPYNGKLIYLSYDRALSNETKIKEILKAPNVDN